jgi:hypothetical protein
MAISLRASVPKGGRPTRRIARSGAGEASGMSAKSIPGRRRIGRSLFAARLARADDANAFAIVTPHAAGRHASQSQESRLLLGVMQIQAVEGIRIAEHSFRLLERDPMLGAVDRGLSRVPLEHGSVYTQTGLASQPYDPANGPSRLAARIERRVPRCAVDRIAVQADLHDDRVGCRCAPGDNREGPPFCVYAAAFSMKIFSAPYEGLVVSLTLVVLPPIDGDG